MKKTLLAAALALGFTGVAQAETSVTLYGILDTGIGYTQYKTDNAVGSDTKISRTGLHDGVNSGNRWGLRGSEDLGNGLRAIFQLESGFTLSDGESGQGGKLFGREASLGLQSDNWGTLKFGRQTNIASQFLGGLASPFGDAFAEAHIGHTFTSMATVRADNVISYVTPSFSGFRFGAAYSFNTSGAQYWDVEDHPSIVDNPDDDNVKLLSLGLLYANGPLAVGASYDQLSSEGYDDKPKAWNIAASYDFEVVKLHLGYGQERDGVISSRGLNADYRKLNLGTGLVDGNRYQIGRISGEVDGYKANNYSVGLSAPLGAGTIMAAWSMSDLSSGAFKDAAAEDSQHTYSVGYSYPFSKRTNMYAVGTYGTGYAFTDTDVTQVIVGLRHRF